MSSDWIKYLLVFTGVTIADFAWGRYIIATSNKKALPAITYAVIIYLIGAFNMITVIGDRWALIPAVLGTIVGTYWSVRNK